MSIPITDLKIKTFPDSILRKKARPVKEITEEERRLLCRMSQIMYEHQGIGLAANQIGIDKAIIVVDPGNCLYKLINPRIIKRQGREFMEEGCLSLPGIFIKVRRAKKVTVRALDEYGKGIVIEADGLLGRIFQHELDHLNARLIIDYASLFDRIKFKRKIAQLKRKGEDEKLPQSEKESREL